MAMEKVLAQILSELQNLNTRQAAMEQQLVAFQQFTLERFDRLENRFDRLEARVERLEGKVDKLEVGQTRTNLILENEIRPTIQALAEGQAMQQAQLDRIEKQVTTHDEIIFKRVL